MFRSAAAAGVVVAVALLVVLTRPGRDSPYQRAGSPGTARLMRRLGLDPRDVVAARVSGRQNGSFSIDVGSRRGVGANAPVLSGGTLVGIVSSSNTTSAYAEAVNSPISSFTADIAGRTAATGTLAGTDQPRVLQFSDVLPGTQIPAGALIETSADADGPAPAEYPPGIPVARITSTRQTQHALTVVPLVDLGALRTVQVLTHVHQPGDPPGVGVLLDHHGLPAGTAYVVITQACAARRCVLTFGNGVVVSCLASVTYLADELADVPRGSCIPQATRPVILRSAGTLNRCGPHAVRVEAERQAAGQTEQLVQTLVLRNVSARSCVLSGYPTVVPYADTLPVRPPVPQDDAAGGHRPPVLKLAPRDQAYVLLTRGTCQLGGRPAAGRVPNQLRVYLPGAGGIATGTVAGLYDDCPAHDPGNGVGVSPISTTPQAAQSSTG